MLSILHRFLPDLLNGQKKKKLADQLKIWTEKLEDIKMHLSGGLHRRYKATNLTLCASSLFRFPMPRPSNKLRFPVNYRTLEKEKKVKESRKDGRTNLFY